MNDPKQQAIIDAHTWMPVAFFTFVEDHDGDIVHHILHQMWVSALGQTEWRKVETRNLKAMAKAYAECNAFNENPDDGEF